MVRLLVYSLWIFISSISSASAWLQPPRKSELITKYEYKTIIPNQNSPPFSFNIYDVFYQYGLNEKITIGLKTQGYNYISSNLANYNNRSKYYIDNDEDAFTEETESTLYNHYKKSENIPLETKILAQTKIYSKQNSILSIQPSIIFHSQYLDKELELRGLYGYNFKLGSEYSYINIEIAGSRRTYKFFAEEADTTSFKLDLTFALALNKKHTAMFQSFYIYNKALYGNNYYNSGEVSWLYKYNEYLTWQTGYATNFTHREQYISQSVITGLWLKF